MSAWFERAMVERGRRALERQLEYQEAKAAAFKGNTGVRKTENFLRSQALRHRLSQFSRIEPNASVIEVGSGPHGLIFGFEAGLGVGIDPLAVEYKRLFPDIQRHALTVAAMGEELPFADGSFDVVLSDNVIDHATRPLRIVDELVRVLRTGGLLYFTVNVHHPVYDLASKAHGAWNTLGIKVELSAFADHTVHLTERRIRDCFERLPIETLERTVDLTRSVSRPEARAAEKIAKKVFFKNALFELIARKT
jgi:SAM-dependent methyltransferase